MNERRKIDILTVRKAFLKNKNLSTLINSYKNNKDYDVREDPEKTIVYKFSNEE
ncbi:MAG: hypothetical protein WC390_11925 [Sulfurimonas sp.]|jgi:hypothetical protein